MEKSLSKNYYLNSSIYNLNIVSRTAKGILDFSSTPNKKNLFAISNSSKASFKAINNFKKAIDFLYKHRKKVFKSPSEIKKFIESISLKINHGILKENYLYRKENSKKFPYTKVKDIQKNMDLFCNTLFELLKNGEEYKELAAYTIYRIDFSDHFFADGCGKTALAFSTWILMKGNSKLPTYKSREDYYKNAPRKVNNKSYSSWKRYYLSLF